MHACRTYLRAPRPIHFPSEETLDERVPETKRHLEARTTLYLLLKDAFASVAIGCGQFVYWEVMAPERRLSPDVFVKVGRRDDAFDNWKTWERSAPDLAVEIVSPLDPRDADWEDQLERYQASGIAEVVRFDPQNAKQPIRVWDRLEGDLVERSPDDTDLRECAALHLWWTVIDSVHGPTLRLARDQEGTQLLLTPSEDRLRLMEEIAKERMARRVAEQARMVLEQEIAEHAAATESARLKEELAQARGERR